MFFYEARLMILLYHGTGILLVRSPQSPVGRFLNYFQFEHLYTCVIFGNSKSYNTAAQTCVLGTK